MLDVDMPKDGYCKAVVWKRDTYRRTGRTRSGFEMHYTRCQCSRRATGLTGYCGQHFKIAIANGHIPTPTLDSICRSE